MESLRVTSGKAEILSGNQQAWASPETWEVKQGLLADLNRDGRLEAVLLVWRPFRPWPVDSFRPQGGRIESFQDPSGRSCHLILIGWERGAFRERWAGSALAEPLTAFASADLDGDGFQELVALEGEYNDQPGIPAHALTVWEWNGFGFTLLAREKGNFSRFQIVRNRGGEAAILAGR